MTIIQRRKRLRYGTSTIDYLLVKSKRIKTSEIIVEGKDKVIVRAPFDKPLSEIEGLIQDKYAWILKKQIEYQESNPEIKKPTFEAGSTLPYLGKNYPTNIFKRQLKNSINFVDQQFMIRLQTSPSSSTTKDHSDLITKLYNGWLMKTARPIFKNKVEEVSSKLGIDKPSEIGIKKLKNRWGSLTPSGAINLNVNLLKAPSDVIDYVILHELCHFKIKEHSHHYWDLVYKHMPNYQEKIDWLNVNGVNLI